MPNIEDLPSYSWFSDINRLIGFQPNLHEGNDSGGGGIPPIPDVINEIDNNIEDNWRDQVDFAALKKKMEDEETRLRVMMIPRKHRGLYQSMTKARKKRVQEAKKLERKRKYLDENSARDAKSAKKTKKAAKA